LTHSTSILITPNKAEKNYWQDLWRFRELFYILSWRDIKVRYKQTSIGILWALIRPLLTIIIFTFVFGKVAGLNQNTNIPYSIIVCAGILPWQFFSTAFSDASNSLINSSNLISKVYFPRMIVPASSIITSFIDFAIAFLILIGLMIYNQFLPPIQIIALPIFIVLLFFVALGISLFFTALNVKYRDFRYIIPFIIQIGMYISPVGFNTQEIIKKIGSNFKDLIYINPIVGIIDGFRWCIIGEPMYWRGFSISLIVIVFFMWLGISYFRKTEKSFADNI
jgi:lipopolysaccharide transport system permease protein